MTASDKQVALLRGINVGGSHKVPMAELRELAAALGWRDVQTYIQSGNLLARAAGAPATLEARLEAAIERRFGFAVPVVVRSREAWAAYVAGNPLVEASRAEPKLVHLALAKRPPASGAVEGLRARAADGERIEGVGDALWIHYPQGAGRSKLTPALFDRLAGSPVTARNWNTVLELAARLGA